MSRKCMKLQAYRKECRCRKPNPAMLVRASVFNVQSAPPSPLAHDLTIRCLLSRGSFLPIPSSLWRVRRTGPMCPRLSLALALDLNFWGWRLTVPQSTILPKSRRLASEAAPIVIAPDSTFISGTGFENCCWNREHIFSPLNRSLMNTHKNNPFLMEFLAKILGARIRSSDFGQLCFKHLEARMFHRSNHSQLTH